MAKKMNRSYSCLMMATTITIAVSFGGQAQCFASDFSKVQRTYVPPSLIERRIDFSSTSESNAVVQHRAPTSANGTGTGSDALIKHRTPTLSSTVNKTVRGKTASAPNAIPVTGKKTTVLPPPSNREWVQAGKTLHGEAKKALSTPASKQAIATLKAKAEELVRSGKLDQAKGLVAKALQLTPKDKTLVKAVSAVAVTRAKQFATSSDFDNALKYARNAVAFDTTNAEARKTLDGILQKVGVNPSDPVQRLRAGDQLAAQGANDEAWVEYQTSAKIQPSADAHVGLGNLATKSGQPNAAKHHYQAAIEVDANSSAAHRQLGMLKLSHGDIVGANSELSRALIVNPKDEQAANSLVGLWKNQVTRVPGANSHLGLARAYQLAGDLQSAQGEYRTVVQLEPENPHLPAARQAFKLALSRQESDKAVDTARRLESQGQLIEAYGKVNEAVQLSPGDAELHTYRGFLAEKLQNPIAAKESYATALKINPNHPVAGARIGALPTFGGGGLAPLPQQPVQSLVAPSAAIAAAAGSPPSNRPLPTDADVNNISNFATSLRDHMMAQKNQYKAVEDIAQSVLQGGSASSSFPDLNTATTDGAAGSPGPNLAGVSDTLSSAAAAVSAANGTPIAGSPKATAAQQPQSLQQQNNALKQRLSSMQQSLDQARGSNGFKTEQAQLDNSIGTNPVPPTAPPINSSLYSAAPTGAMGSLPVPSLSSGALQQSSNFAADGMPPVAPSIGGALGAPPSLRPKLPVSEGSLLMPPPGAALDAMAARANGLTSPVSVSNVHLSLAGAAPKVGGVDLNVVLRNDADTALPIPGKLKAIIKYSNRKDAEVKADFAETSVPPHSQVRGVIKVPFDKVDPTADLMIPGLLPPGSGVRDVHLITNLASR